MTEMLHLAGENTIVVDSPPLVETAGLNHRLLTYDPAFQNQLSGLSKQLLHAGATGPDAQVQAYGRIYRSLQVQSQTLAYIDTFMVLAVAAGIMFLLAFIVRRNDPGGGHAVVE